MPESPAPPVAASLITVLAMDESHNQLGSQRRPVARYEIEATSAVALDKRGFTFKRRRISTRPLAPVYVTLTANGAKFIVDWPPNSDKCEVSAKTLRSMNGDSTFIGFQRGSPYSLLVDYEDKVDTEALIVPGWAAVVVIK